MIVEVSLSYTTTGLIMVSYVCCFYSLETNFDWNKRRSEQLVLSSATVFVFIMDLYRLSLPSTALVIVDFTI